MAPTVSRQAEASLNITLSLFFLKKEKVRDEMPPSSLFFL